MIRQTPPRFQSVLSAAVLLPAILWAVGDCAADTWPRWRGPDGQGVAGGRDLPLNWSRTENVRWKVRIPGEGSSSPIVWHDRVFVTSALEGGTRRNLHCLDRETGRILWTGTTNDDNPERTSALTGHAAATPVTDGERVVAFFGNAGVVCYDHDGTRQWQRSFGEFDTELGLAASPVVWGETVILVCDHDGTAFRSFDSFLIALDLRTGETRWKTDRTGLESSWSTPIVVRTPAGDDELIVSGEEELRAYNPADGELLWRVPGLTGWVAPSPVFCGGLVLATSGRNGPVLAVRPGGRGDVSMSHVAWRHGRGGPYVCSPVCDEGRLFVHDEQGILTCYEAATGRVIWRHRLDGSFKSSGIVADGRLLLTSEAGCTSVIAAGPEFRLLAENRLDEEVLASPAVAGDALFLRTDAHLYCIRTPKP